MGERGGRITENHDMWDTEAMFLLSYSPFMPQLKIDRHSIFHIQPTAVVINKDFLFFLRVLLFILFRVLCL